MLNMNGIEIFVAGILAGLFTISLIYFSSWIVKIYRKILDGD